MQSLNVEQEKKPKPFETLMYGKCYGCFIVYKMLFVLVTLDYTAKQLMSDCSGYDLFPMKHSDIV